MREPPTECPECHRPDREVTHRITIPGQAVHYRCYYCASGFEMRKGADTVIERLPR